MRLLAYYLVVLAMIVWAGWVGYIWVQGTRESDAAIATRITRNWPVGKRQLELRDRIRDAQEAARRDITTRMILQGGLGLIVLHLVSLGLKENRTPD